MAIGGWYLTMLYLKSIGGRVVRAFGGLCGGGCAGLFWQPRPILFAAMLCVNTCVFQGFQVQMLVFSMFARLFFSDIVDVIPTQFSIVFLHIL